MGGAENEGEVGGDTHDAIRYMIILLFTGGTVYDCR